MNKINLTAAGSTLGTASYVSPEAKVTEIHSEGVLCMSSLELLQQRSFGHEEWNTSDTDLWS